MSTLDPGLKYLAQSTDADWQHIALVSTFSIDLATPTAPRARLLVELETASDGALAALAQLGFVAHARAGTVVSGDIPVRHLSRLEQVSGLKRAEAARALSNELDAALPEANVVPLQNGGRGRLGPGVIIGIIDSGIDFQHPAFLNADGSTRILAIWDQGLMPTGAEASPAGFNYGVEYRRAAIDAALNSAAPGTLVRHVDPAPFHGTHVAGIAAGNGEPANAPASGGMLRFVGVAPGTELIVVANTRGQAQNRRGLGDSVDTLDAVRYILDFANGLRRPVVINHSQGDNLGPHDGTSVLEVGIDNLINGPGHVLVKSAGNEGNTAHHAQGMLIAGRPDDVTFVVGSNVPELIIDLWYPGANHIGVRITPQSGGLSALFQAPFNGTVNLANGNSVVVDADLADPANGDNRTFLIVKPGTLAFVEQGQWTLQLNGSGPWHAWMQRESDATFEAAFASPAVTISIPGTSRAAITVGSYVNHGLFVAAPPGSLSKMSSRGPTRDGRQAPTLTAPGEEIMSPQPSPVFFGAMKGTSMSAPLVAGAVALMLAIKKTLTADDIRKCLEGSARLDGDTGAAASNDWGAGKLDVKAACDSV